MRHRKSVLKLNRTPSHRKAMFRNMVTELFRHGRITTTTVKAKEARSLAERRGEEAVVWAEAAIEEAKAINDREALEAPPTLDTDKVIDSAN